MARLSGLSREGRTYHFEEKISMLSIRPIKGERVNRQLYDKIWNNSMAANAKEDIADEVNPALEEGC